MTTKQNFDGIEIVEEIQAGFDASVWRTQWVNVDILSPVD